MGQPNAEFLLPETGGRPAVGRITGRGNTANLEAVLALKPELILDIGTWAEGGVREVLARAQLGNLYGAPVEMLTDAATGTSAFLPG
jgi:ABC-type Fe3+-hydroxamate transport system substrate-binding protein